MHWIYWVLKCAQAVILLVAIVVYGCLLRIIARKRVYNSNLTLLLIFLPIPSIVGSFMLTMQGILSAFEVYSIWSGRVMSFILELGFGSAVFNLPNLVVDRLVATVSPARYEIKDGQVPWLAIALITTQILATGGFLLLCLTYQLNQFACAIAVVVISIISCMGLAFLPRLSKKLCEYYQKRYASVSVRYQSVENLRAAKLLKPLVAVYMCFFLIERTIFFHTFYFIVDHSELFSALWTFSLSTVVSLEILSTTLVIASSYSSLPRFATACCRRSRQVHVMYANGGDVRSVDGRPLSFNVNFQRDFYFENLKVLWDPTHTTGLTTN